MSMGNDKSAQERQTKTDRRAAALRENLRRRKVADTGKKDNNNTNKSVKDDAEHETGN